MHVGGYIFVCIFKLSYFTLVSMYVFAHVHCTYMYMGKQKTLIIVKTILKKKINGFTYLHE
jgi:hypothetical protein